MKIYQIRKQYGEVPLNQFEMDVSPFVEFEKWLKRAISKKVLEPTAMALATATIDGIPSCRMVLLKGWSKRGGLFFTDYRSRKGVELIENPNACCTFWWKELEQQVIIECVVEKVSRQVSSRYFHQRPRGSQLAARISVQGQELLSRDILENGLKAEQAKYRGKVIPLPDHWGGFLIKPTKFHFWQGRRDRLHDRFTYLKKGNRWALLRIYP